MTRRELREKRRQLEAEMDVAIEELRSTGAIKLGNVTAEQWDAYVAQSKRTIDILAEIVNLPTYRECTGAKRANKNGDRQ